jgi:hypothetical protein
MMTTDILRHKNSFAEWMRKVNAIVESKLGLSVHCLADMDFRSAYEDEVTPEDFVNETVREEIQSEFGDEYADLLGDDE